MGHRPSTLPTVLADTPQGSPLRGTRPGRERQVQTHAHRADDHGTQEARLSRRGRTTSSGCPGMIRWGFSPPILRIMGYNYTFGFKQSGASIMAASGLIVVLGIIGSVASIVGLLIAAPGVKSKIVHIVYALVLTAIASSAVVYYNRMSAALREVEEINRIENEAQAILNSSDRSTAG